MGDLAALGYETTWTCVRAVDVGASHRRDRMFIAAAHPQAHESRGRPCAQRRGQQGRQVNLCDVACADLLPTPTPATPTMARR
ncbi:DNA cytosine methyltransferase [Actinoallomurus sp. CA-142502]|uniref:DNA cytosine methyltransferase n=1 Tax=Actinoallomurus sp. CA-142502 TaxID=3239885 RepID=UPI003D8FD07B